MRRLLSLALIVAVVLAGGVGYYAGSRHALAPAYVMASADCATFPQTGKTVCGRFLEYWQANGALAQQGLPLSDEFREVSAVNQQTYTVQYFERAVFEMHPENARPYDVLLTLLGREKFLAKYPGGDTSAPPQGTAITYAVIGTGGVVRASLTYRNEQGGTEQLETTLPWSKSFTVKSGAFLYISAQNISNVDGTISCDITANGQPFKHSQSRGVAVIASCDGSAP